MSKRMIRRIDMVTAYTRLIALIAIPIVAFAIAPGDLQASASAILLALTAMVVVDAVAVVLVHIEFYPTVAALLFPILDSLFSLVVVFLGGPDLVFYAFIPVVALSVRFDWAAGLADTVVLIIGYALIALLQAGFENVGQVLTSLFGASFSLLFVSLVGGLLAENIKREPPLNWVEVKARDEELQRLRAAADRARAIYEMAGTLSATLNRNKILDAVLDVSAMGFDELAEEGTHFRSRPPSAVFLYGQEGLYVAASRSISYQEVDLPVKGEQGVLHRVLSTGEPCLLSNLTDDPELRRFTAFRRCRSAICVPLRAGFEIYGAILFASPKPGVFGVEHIELLNAVSNQAVVALANAELYQQLQEEKERIIEVEEEARTKLARDLHDGPTQSISAIAMRLNFVRLLLGRDPQKVKDELFKLENLARRTTKEIRTMLFTLRPVVLETQGLKAAVEQLAEKFRDMDNLPIALNIEDLEGQLDVSIQAVAWFITEECLTNVKKHANATHVEVKMYIRDAHFVAEITDNGEGFDVEQVLSGYDQRGSFGLLNLQERAELVNGRTTIQSTPGEGTRVTLVVPLSREAA